MSSMRFCSDQLAAVLSMETIGVDLFGSEERYEYPLPYNNIGESSDEVRFD